MLSLAGGVLGLGAATLMQVVNVSTTNFATFAELAFQFTLTPSQLKAAAAGEFSRLGLALEGVTVQNLSLPEELQKVLDQKIGMGMVGGSAERMGQFMQYQAAQAIPEFAKGAAGSGGGSAGSGIVGDALGLGAGVALGQVMAQQLGQALQGGGAAAAVATPGVKPEEVMATIEKLAALKGRGVLTEDEFAAKKGELLKKIV